MHSPLSREFQLDERQAPEMDGYQATQLIRQSENLAHREIIIIALTANAMKGDREKCIAAGMNIYLTKPISANELKKTIADALQAKAKRIA
jgi:two-component system sensor histidine kinase/response regulator